MSILHLTDASFKKEVLESDLPVLVDFWAQWCAPCKKIAPYLEELAAEFDKKVKIAKLDVDGNAKATAHYGIMSIPTLIFFKHGKVTDQVTGALGKAELKARMEESIK